MLNIVHNNKYFLIAFALWLLAAAAVTFLHSGKEIFYAINSVHNAFFDRFMTVLSAYGRGDTITIIFAALLVIPLYRNKNYLATTISFGLILPLINYFSKAFFSKPRPIGEYSAENVHWVPWLENLYFDSFPSGHTMGAFGFFLLLNHFMPAKKWWMSVFFFLLAFGCGYSRVYLGQHFFADIFAGSIIGVIVSLLIVYCVNLIVQKKKPHV